MIPTHWFAWRFIMLAMLNNKQAEDEGITLELRVEMLPEILGKMEYTYSLN